jgi:hypothetical protein
MDLVAGEGDDTASHVRTIIKRHAIWNRLLRAQRVQRFRQGDVWLRGRPSSACCAVAVLCCKTLVRETSERARPAVLCLPQLLGQPRDARRLNAYAGQTRLPILRSRTLSTRFILSSRFSGPKQIFCCPRSHLFSILLPSPRQATVPQPAREIGERPAYPARSHRLPVSTLHSARLVSALRRCPSSRQTQPVPAGRCSTIPGSRLGPHTHIHEAT